jgi:hypothetical protein
MIPKELHSPFRECLHSIVVAAPETAPAHLIADIFERMSGQNGPLGEPFGSPFATVCQWLTDAADDAALFDLLLIVLDVLRPTSPSSVIAAFASLRQPLHREGLAVVADVLENHFPELKERYCTFPPTLPALATHSYDIAEDCWGIDWPSISGEYHCLVFGRMLLAASITSVLIVLSDGELCELVASAVQPQAEVLDRFARYYTEMFPHTTLAQIFSMRGARFSVFRLESLNLCDDALGFVALRSPPLATAAALEQIGNLAAAKAHYELAMWEHPETYFDAIVRLRKLVLSLTLPRSELGPALLSQPYELDLLRYPPALQDNARRFDFSSARDAAHALPTFFSPAYIPFFSVAALFDEVFHFHKCVVGHQNSIVELAQLTSGIWMESFDDNLAMASCLAWRLSIWSSLLDAKDPAVIQATPQVLECLSKNFSALAVLLDRAGALPAALESAVKSRRPEFVIRVSKDNVPRIASFLAVRGPVTMPALRSNVHITLRAYDRVEATEMRQWLSLLYAAFSERAVQLESGVVMARLLRELNKCEVDSRPALGTIVLRMLAKDPALDRCLVSAAVEMSEGHKRFWIQWLSQLFYCCPSLNVRFLKHMAEPQQSSTAFDLLVQLRDVECSGIIAGTDYWGALTNALYQKPLDRMRNAIVQFGSFIDKCDDQLYSLDVSAELLEKLIICLTTGGEIDPHFDTLDEWVEYCDSNPPVFFPSRSLAEFFASSPFRSPLFGQPMTRMSIDADGTHEARLRLIRPKGDFRIFCLVSPRLYSFSQRESILMRCISQLVQRHPSCSAKSHFLNYPRSYRIHPRLVAVDSRELASIREIVHPFRGAFSAIRGSTISDDCLLTWVIIRSDGNRNNFLVARNGIAAHFGAIACLQTIFKRILPVIPPLLFGGEGRTVYCPGLFSWSVGVPIPPLTDQIARLIPREFRNGACAAAWQAVADTLAHNQDQVRALIGAFVRGEEGVEERIAKVAIAGDDPWAFNLVHHQMDCANNALRADPVMLAWL